MLTLPAVGPFSWLGDSFAPYLVPVRGGSMGWSSEKGMVRSALLDVPMREHGV